MLLVFFLIWNKYILCYWLIAFLHFMDNNYASIMLSLLLQENYQRHFIIIAYSWFLPNLSNICTLFVFIFYF